MICDDCKKEVFRGHFDQEQKKWLCGHCYVPPEIRASVPGAIFPFVTTNLSADPSRPVTVKSLRHLRQLEAKHGVQSVAFNVDSKNFGDRPSGREQSR